MGNVAVFSFILLVSGLLFSAAGGRSRIARGFATILGLSCALLLIGYLLANHFTGEGINSAVWYHLRYGLGGAGFQDYRALIAITALALLATPVVVVGLLRWNRHGSRRTGLLVGGQVLLTAALAVNPGARDLVALVRTPAPAMADFYQHFQPASLTSVSREHRSFIFIFGESLERTFFDEQRFPGLITRLRALEARGTTFTAIHTVEGTGFTMGGMVASLCGVPLFTPAHANSMSGMDSFLPGAVGLPDLLHERGYFLSFMGGASLDFAGKGKFLTTHHFDESAGFSELHGRTQDRAYINNWGLYDDTLFDFAYERVTQLAGQARPFGLFLLTLDTHSPDGHRSKSVNSLSYGDGTNPMLNAVKASDELIGRFVERVWSSPLGKDLVIVVVSDHLAMMNAASAQLNQGPRSNLFLILDPRDPTPRRVDRVGSTLDSGVTLLPTLGFKGRMNLGRDLRDPATSDEQIAHIQNTETLLAWRPEIIGLWEFPRLTKKLSFDPVTARVAIDGRSFKAPVLVELGRDGRTTLRFQFDALYDPHLAEQATKLPPDTTYLLVADPKDAQVLLSGEAPPTNAPWVLIAGKVGQRPNVVPLASQVTWSKSQVDELLRK